MNAGALLGGLAGTGCWLAVTGLPRGRRPTLAERIAPYLTDAVPPSRLLAPASPVTALPALLRLLAPVLGDLGTRLDRLLGGAASARRRLDCLGRGQTLEQFRVEQVLWGAGGLGGGLLLTLAAAALHLSASPAALLVLALACGVAGVVGRDHMLSRAVARRQARLVAELPTVAELLALAVAAGEGPLAAVERVAAGHGELPAELRRVVADVRSGAPLTVALAAAGRRCDEPAVARFADAVVVAVERGTPLADVLRAQACDAREAGRRALLEVGGRKEIAMMVPVVFLVLPVTVLFALFPGLAAFTFTTS